MPQFGRPIADTTLGNYQDEGGGTTTIYDGIDESVASDADYIRSPTNPNTEVYVARLTSLTDPVSSSGHVLRVRAGTDQAAGGNQIDLTAQLRQGYTNEGSPGTLIATLTQANISQGSFTDYSVTLSGAEADSITDYTVLYVRIVLDVP